MKQRHDGFIQTENDADITQREQRNIFISFYVTGLRTALRVEGICGQPVSTKSSNITDVLENKPLHKTTNFICFHLIRPEGFQERSYKLLNMSEYTHAVNTFHFNVWVQQGPHNKMVHEMVLYSCKEINNIDTIETEL